MSVEHLELLVEEQSMEAALELLLPKIIGPLTFSIHPHQGKPDLLQKLPSRLRGYAGDWLPDTFRIIVLVDRDDEDCEELKERLEAMAAAAGLGTRSSPKRGRYKVVNRLAIEELEAWFFGDWDAVRAAYPRVKASIRSQAKYRNPDAIAGGTWEAFERVLQSAGYFKTKLRKIEAARAVAEHMVPGRNRSKSFGIFRDALLELVPA